MESPQHAHKVQPPHGDDTREWLSYVLLVGIGAAMYPQAIQRIYAARSEETLRRSLSVMAFMPLITTLVAVIVGVMGIAHLPPLEGADSDKVLSVMFHQVALGSTFGYWLVVMLLAAILAALMSTADSSLLSISSMFTKDIYGRFWRPEIGEHQLMRVGKACSWLLLAGLVSLAIALRENTTLIDLLDQKFNILVQLSPAFILGIHWRRLHSRAVLAGLIAGLALALGLVAAGHGKPMGIHAGLYGLAVNVSIAVGWTLLATRRPE